MKSSARVAYLFIILFFLLFNGVQVYLILQRVAGAKAKFNVACTETLQSTLFQYNKIKATDSVAKPKIAMVSWSMIDMAVNRVDSQNIEVKSPSARLYAMRIDPAVIEGIISRPKPVALDLGILDSLYGKALDSINIHSSHRLDTFPIQIKPGNNRRSLPEYIDSAWASERSKKFAYSTRPQRMFFYPTAMVFGELNYDRRFLWKELFWPMLAFFFILLISNTALYFVYKTIRRQKRVNEVKTDFINNLTHEMKTPITIASAGLEALEHHTSTTERTRFYLDTSKRHLRVLNDFVERILDAAVQDIPDFTLKNERIDLHGLFDQVIQSQSLLNGKSARFNLTGAAPAIIQGDRLHLETAFHNIIDNAIKYSNGAVEIHIDIVDNARDCTISIRDNGMGIPPQYLKNIFEKFFRVPQGDAQAIKGFGLGLYYVHNIVKKHSGNITVQSKLQSGTEFIITLPKNT